MKNVVYILFLTLIRFCAFGQNLENIRIVNKLENVKPGAYFSLFIEVDRSFHESFPENESVLKIPEGWSILSEKILNKETGVRYMYTITTSKETASKSHFLSFGLYIKGNIIAYKSIEVKISETYFLEIIPLEKKEYVIEGDTLVTSFLIQNLGNASEKVFLSSTTGRLVSDTLTIQPNASKVVKVTQIVPFTKQTSWHISSDIHLKVANRIPLFQVVSIPVYTDRQKKLDNHLRLPIVAGLNYVNYKLGNVNFSALQFDVSGKGHLDYGKKHYVDFVALGPSNTSLPTLGGYSQYSALYKYKEQSIVTLGDYSNHVSNLLEFGRFGRGVKLEQKINNNTVSVFFQKSRFSSNQKYAFGGSYELQLEHKNSVKFNYMSKKLSDNAGEFMSNLVSTSGYFNWKNLEIDAEVSFGLAKNKLDMAIYSKARYKIGKLLLQNQLTKAGKNYHGFYNNSNFFLNAINYQISKELFIGVTNSYSLVNPSQDIFNSAVSPISKSNSIFMNYTINRKNTVALNYTNQEREDRMEISSFHYKESYGNFSYRYTSERLEINSQTRFGKTANLLVSDTEKSRKSYGTTLQPHVAITPWLNLGGYAEYQHTNKFSSDNSSQNLIYYGGNVSMNYKDFIRLNFMYRNNYAPDELFEKRNYSNASLSFNFKNHSLSLVGGRAFSPSMVDKGQNSSFFSIKYTVKLNPSVAKDENIGQLSGKLIALNAGIQKKGIMVRLGPYTALTDSSGSFHFNNISPNKYIFSIPPTFELAGVVSQEKTPLEINIVANRTEYLEVGLVKTGGIAGVLDFSITEKYSIAKDGQNKPTVLVKLTNGEESYLTTVTKSNTYSFKEVKPGDWKLTMYIPGNQREYEITDNVLNVQIASSKIEMANFTLRSIERKIQSTGQEFHLSSTNK